MEQGDVVMLGDMPVGTFFFDNDGDLSVVIPHDGSTNGKCGNEVCCRYWSASMRMGWGKYENPEPTRDELPDPESGSVIHWAPEYEWEIVMLPQPPVTDEEVAAALASIMGKGLT